MKKTQFFVAKITRIWWIFVQALKGLKNVHFDWSLLCKVYNVWPKKVQRSYISWHWRVMRNLKKNWLVVWKMTWGIRAIFTRARKSLKIGTLMTPFCLKLKMYELKIYRGIMCHGNELTCQFKIDMRNLTNFDLSTQKSQSLHFNGLLLTIVYDVWAEKVQGSYAWRYWILMQNLKANWLVLSKMTWGIWQMFTRACSKV